jgi:hypothetical protein
MPGTFAETDMNHVIKHSERPGKNTLWQALPQPVGCFPKDEAIIRQEAGVLKRCFQRGSLEAQ